MARMLSHSLTGKQIDGIWHTSIVVYGMEICFGQGIETATPGTMSYGSPIQKIDMGITNIPLDVFHEYLSTMREVWTADKYHLLDNNCNSFSNQVSLFLTGREIPSFITSLPDDFVSTPLGQAIRPMIENMYSQNTNRNQSSYTGNTMINNWNSQLSSIPRVSNLSDLNTLIRSEKAFVVYFSSDSCSHYKLIYSELQDIMQEYKFITWNKRWGAIPVLTVVQVDVEKSRDICSSLDITSTPAFQFYSNGAKFDEFNGANVTKLKTCISLLMEHEFPTHPHTKLNLSICNSLSKSPILYKQHSSIPDIFKKLESFIESQKTLIIKKNTIDGALNWISNASECDFNSKEINSDWDNLMCQLITNLETAKLFPVLDLLRLWILVPKIYENIEDHNVLISKVLELFIQKDLTNVTKKMLFKFIVNLCSRNGEYIQKNEDIKAPILDFIVDGILNLELSEMATNALYNICRNDDFMLDENLVMECVPALMESISISIQTTENDISDFLSIF